MILTGTRMRSQYVNAGATRPTGPSEARVQADRDEQRRSPSVLCEMQVSQLGSAMREPGSSGDKARLAMQTQLVQTRNTPRRHERVTTDSQSQPCRRGVRGVRGVWDQSRQSPPAFPWTVPA
jgi:hypothetical protein